MSLAFPLGAAALAAACGWPASAATVALSVPPGSPPQRGCPPCGSASVVASSRSRFTRHCHAALQPAPLLMAVPMAVLAYAAASFVRPPLVACAACWLVICAVPLAVIDLAVRRLPDVLTGASGAGVAAFLLAAAASGDHWRELASAGGGALALAGLFVLLAVSRPGSAGLGDAKLGLSIGGLAAWFGWGVLIEAVLAGFLLAAGYGVWLIMARRASLASSLAFGPFMIAGAVLVVFLARAG